MFSKQLILKAVDFLPATHNDLKNEVIRLDLDSRNIKFNGSIGNKKQALQEYLLSNPDAVDNYGDSILLKMMNSVVKIMITDVEYGRDEFDDEKAEFLSDKDFYRYLLLEGYDIDFDKACIVEDIANYTHVAEKNDNIVNLLKEYNFTISLGHYNQAKSSFLGGNYASLNSQLRTFVEAIFQDMAGYIKLSEPMNTSLKSVNQIDAQSAMVIFTKCNKPILDINLNEWDGDGTTISYFPAFWKRLHPQGSHPGLPELYEAIYRFQLVVLNIELLIKRFKTEYPLRSY